MKRRRTGGNVFAPAQAPETGTGTGTVRNLRVLCLARRFGRRLGWPRPGRHPLRPFCGAGETGGGPFAGRCGRRSLTRAIFSRYIQSDAGLAQARLRPALRRASALPCQSGRGGSHEPHLRGVGRIRALLATEVCFGVAGPVQSITVGPVAVGWSPRLGRASPPPSPTDGRCTMFQKRFRHPTKTAQ